MLSETKPKLVEAATKPVEAAKKPAVSILGGLLYGIPITLIGAAAYAYSFIASAESKLFKIVSSTQAELVDEKASFMSGSSLLFFFLGGILVLVGAVILSSINSAGPSIPIIGATLMLLVMTMILASVVIQTNQAVEKSNEYSAWVLSQLSITGDYIPESSNLDVNPGAPGELGEPAGITLEDGSVVSYRVNAEEGTNYITVEQISRTDGAPAN